MSSPCFPGVLCRNLNYGKFKCGDCPDGYEWNGVKCVDIDEVKINLALFISYQSCFLNLWAIIVNYVFLLCLMN